MQIKVISEGGRGGGGAAEAEAAGVSESERDLKEKEYQGWEGQLVSQDSTTKGELKSWLAAPLIKHSNPSVCPSKEARVKSPSTVSNHAPLPR